MNRFVMTIAGNWLRSATDNVSPKFSPLNKYLHLSKAQGTGIQPCYISCEKGKPVQWCACGHSNKQPLCDGSHKTKGQGKTPLTFVPPEAKDYLMCVCKKTKKQPLCDGSQGGCRSFV